MKQVKVKFNGYEISKTQPNRKSLYDNTNVLHRENEVINEAYKAANSIYPMHDWRDVMYSREDFMQDAAIYIVDKFKTGYFDGSKENLFPIIYRLIDGYFTYNKKKDLQKCATYGNSLNAVAHTPNDGYIIEYLDFIQDEQPYEIEDLIYGDTCVKRIVYMLDPTPFVTRKHTYSCNLGGKTHKLNEAIIGAMLVEGKDLHDILDIFGCGTSWSGGSSKSSYIAKVVSRTKKKILDEVKKLSGDSKESVIGLLVTKSATSFL